MLAINQIVRWICSVHVHMRTAVCDGETDLMSDHRHRATELELVPLPTPHGFFCFWHALYAMKTGRVLEADSKTLGRSDGCLSEEHQAEPGWYLLCVIKILVHGPSPWPLNRVGLSGSMEAPTPAVWSAHSRVPHLTMVQVVYMQIGFFFFLLCNLGKNFDKFGVGDIYK